MGRWQKGVEGSGGGIPRTRNVVRVCLDGTDGKEALPSFQQGLTDIFDWCRAYGIVRDVSSIFGPNTEVVTTPPGGTFHLELEHTGRILEVIINGRDLYFRGWRGPNGSYEINEEDRSNSKKNTKKSHNYMLGEDVRAVHIGMNYQYLAPDSMVGNTKLGIYDLRRAFNALINYNGGSPGRIAEAIGIIAVYISEATRFHFVRDTECTSFIDDKVSRLRHAPMDLRWLNRWSHYSGELMEQIDYLLSGKTPPKITCRGIEVNCAQDILRVIQVLHIDAYNEGKFAHAPPPKVMVEQPIDASMPKLIVEKLVHGSEQMMEGGKRNKHKGKSAHNKSEKLTKRASMGGKEDTRGPAASPPSRRGYSTSSSVSSTFPPASLESWRHYVEQNSESLKFLSSLSRGGCGGSVFRHLGAPLHDSMSHIPDLRHLCRLTYERRKHQKTTTSFQNSVSTFRLGLKSTTLAEAQHSRAKVVEVRYRMTNLCKTTPWFSLQASVLPSSSRPRVTKHQKTTTSFQNSVSTFRLGLKSTTAEAQHSRAKVVEVRCRMKNLRKTTPWFSFQASVLPSTNPPRVLPTRPLRTNNFGETNSKLPQKPPLQQVGVWISRLTRLLRR